MSTGADAKAMPLTAEGRDNHERTFGEHRPQGAPRKVWVMRCGPCDGAQHPEEAKLYMCPKCRAWTFGAIDASLAPPLREEHEARAAPFLIDRFMENSQATDGTDIGSRRKRKEYMAREGVTDKSDYKPDWTERVRTQREHELSKATRETVARVVYERWKL